MKRINATPLTLRRACQTFSLLFLIYIIWRTRYPLSGFISPELFFKIDPLVMITTSIAERIFLAGIFFSSIVLLLTFIFGRVFCGWICPLGGVMDLMARIKGGVMKIVRRRATEGEPGRFILIKYVFLSAVLLFSFLGLQTAWVLDPIAIFVRTFSFIILPFVNNLFDQTFILLLKISNYNTVIDSMYNFARDSLLDSASPGFNHTGVIAALFAIILFLVFVKRRFWCRYICPLGGMLASAARFSPFGRVVTECGEHCHLCKNICRMNAIKGDNSYLKEECVLCLDCTERCLNQKSKFTFARPMRRSGENTLPDRGISRAEFISGAALLMFWFSGFSKLYPGAVKPPDSKKYYLRPPGALPEPEFIQRCIRCGNCMKVCPTNVLQPSPVSKGLRSLWTPHLDTNRGYCEYHCNLCGQVCPTEAITELEPEKKIQAIIGIAKINRDLCLPWAKGENCIVCEEHCPVADKAITLKNAFSRKSGRMVLLPEIDESTCIGCAVCEFKCPVTPEKAVRIEISTEKKKEKVNK